MNNADVKSRFQASIKNVGIELKNVEHLTKEKIDLSKEWQDFMKAHMDGVEKKAKAWFSDRIVKETEGQINDMIKKLQALEKDLKAKEIGKDKATHEKTAKAASDKLDVEIKTAKAAVEAQEKVVKTRETELKIKRDASTKKNAELRKKSDELNAIVKQVAKEKDATKKATLTKTKDALEKDKARLEMEKRTTDKDKDNAGSSRGLAREEKLAKEKVVGLKQRAKWSLRSKELKDVIDNLEADKKIVAAFKIAGASMKMPAVV
jgi:putative ABC transport system ATP-binding protein